MRFQKTLYATQQLSGLAGGWWATYTTALQQVDHQVPWGGFHTAFCGHHLSAGLVCYKLKEFLNLQ
jgi:hypothetical protein